MVGSFGRPEKWIGYSGVLYNFFLAVVRGVHPLLDAEAVRVVSMMPDWSPGLMGDTPVNVRFSIPVTFRIR